MASAENATPATVIYDSVKLHFHPNIFFRQLMIHLGYPFSLIFSPNIMVQGFGSIDAASLFFNHVVSICVVVMTISYIMTPDPLEGALYTPLACFSLHKMMVAVKYGSMSLSEYGRLMSLTTEQMALATLYAHQLQLIQGLLGEEENVLLFEVTAAARRLHLDLSKISFEIPLDKMDARSQVDQWLTFTTGCGPGEGPVLDKEVGVKEKVTENRKDSSVVMAFDSVKDVDVEKATGKLIAFDSVDSSNYTVNLPVHMPICHLHHYKKNAIDFQYIDVPVDVFCMSLLKQPDGSSVYKSLLERFCLFLIMLVIIIPFIFCTVGVSPWTIIFYITSSVVTLDYFPVLTFFLQGCLFYASRQLAVAQKLGIILRQNSSMFSAAPEPSTAAADRKLAKEKSNKSHLSVHPVYADEEVDDYDDDEDFLLSKTHKPMVPKVSMECAKNAFAWNYSRTMLQSFGMRFKFRLDAYMGGLLIIGVILIAASLYSMSISTDMFYSVLFIQTQLVLFLVTVFLLVILLIGSRANLEFEEHGDSIVGHLVKINFAMAEMNSEIRRLKAIRRLGRDMGDEDDLAIESLEESVHILEETVEALSSIKDMVSSSNTRYPLSILGYSCTYALTYSLFTSVASYFFYLLTVAYGLGL